MQKNLPACPVETTLMLISDRWKVLIIRDLFRRYKTVWGNKEIGWKCIAKSLDGKSAFNGRQRSAYAKSIP